MAIAGYVQKDTSGAMARARKIGRTIQGVNARSTMGGHIVASMRCCTMWTLNKYWSLIASIGESSESTRIASAATNQAICAWLGACQPCRRRSGPIAYV